MFVSVWYAKKMGRRFISNVRKAKKQRNLLTVRGGSDVGGGRRGLWVPEEGSSPVLLGRCRGGTVLPPLWKVRCRKRGTVVGGGTVFAEGGGAKMLLGEARETPGPGGKEGPEGTLQRGGLVGLLGPLGVLGCVCGRGGGAGEPVGRRPCGCSLGSLSWTQVGGRQPRLLDPWGRVCVGDAVWGFVVVNKPASMMVVGGGWK